MMPVHLLPCSGAEEQAGVRAWARDFLVALLVAWPHRVDLVCGTGG